MPYQTPEKPVLQLALDYLNTAQAKFWRPKRAGWHSVGGGRYAIDQGGWP